MISIFQKIRGYLRIKVWGFSPERFMNLCSNKDILLWDIVRDQDVYYMCISLRSFYRLRPIAKKTGTRVVILQRYGLPFFIPDLLRRKMFCAGLVFAICFWMCSSAFVWEIELNGNYQITEDVFMDFLQEEGVRVGMRKGELDIGTLEKEIRRTFPQVTWTSAKLSGTRLQIDIKENDAPIITETEKEEGGSDLVSEYDGIVVSMIVRSGVPVVAIGDTVEQGTVLVEGSVPIYNEDATVKEYRYVQADADIIIEHTIDFTEKLPYDHVKREYTGRTKKKYFLRVGDSEWKLPENRPFLVYDSVVRQSRPDLFEKFSIPLYVGSYTHREYQNVEYEYTLNEAEEILNEKLMTFIATLEEKGVQIIEKNVKIDTYDGNWVISGNFLVQESAGKHAGIEEKDMGETESDE